MLTGSIVAAIHNVNRDARKKPYSWQDVFPERQAETEPQSDEEMFANMMAFAKRREGATN